MKLGRGASVKRVPPIGEMNKPVLFYDPSMVPDDAAGFNTSLKPVAKAWAKIVFGNRSYTKAGDDDSRAVEAHLVVIQNPGVPLPKGTYMLHDKTMYRAVYSRPIDDREEFLSLYVVDRGAVKDGDFTVTDPEGTPVAESKDSPPTDGLWKDGF